MTEIINIGCFNKEKTYVQFGINLGVTVLALPLMIFLTKAYAGLGSIDEFSHHLCYPVFTIFFTTASGLFFLAYAHKILLIAFCGTVLILYLSHYYDQYLWSIVLSVCLMIILMTPVIVKRWPNGGWPMNQRKRVCDDH